MRDESSLPFLRRRVTGLLTKEDLVSRISPSSASPWERCLFSNEVHLLILYLLASYSLSSRRSLDAGSDCLRLKNPVSLVHRRQEAQSLESRSEIREPICSLVPLTRLCVRLHDDTKDWESLKKELVKGIPATKLALILSLGRHRHAKKKKKAE